MNNFNMKSLSQQYMQATKNNKELKIAYQAIKDYSGQKIGNSEF